MRARSLQQLSDEELVERCRQALKELGSKGPLPGNRSVRWIAQEIGSRPNAGALWAEVRRRGRG